jgi:hypothetical protein
MCKSICPRGKDGAEAEQQEWQGVIQSISLIYASRNDCQSVMDRHGSSFNPHSIHDKKNNECVYMVRGGTILEFDQ